MQPEITIKRDSSCHSWVIVNGSHTSQTPWEDTASAISVKTWLQDKAGGAITVIVDLAYA